MALIWVGEYDIPDTPYLGTLIDRTDEGEVWAIYCAECRWVFPVEIREPGLLYEVPWEPCSLDELPFGAREQLEAYVEYRQAAVVEDGCAH